MCIQLLQDAQKEIEVNSLDAKILFVQMFIPTRIAMRGRWNDNN